MKGHDDIAKENRIRLLNIAAGGDGHTAPWIEKVTYSDAPADAPQHAYMVHYPQSIERDGTTSPAVHVGYFVNVEAARALLHATETGAQPRSPETTADKIRAAQDAIPVTDSGRIIPYGGN